MADTESSAKPAAGGGALGLILQVLNTILIAGVLALQLLRPGGVAAKKPANDAAKPEATAEAGHGEEHAEAKEPPKADEHGSKEEKAEEEHAKEGEEPEHKAEGEKGGGHGGAAAAPAGPPTIQIADFVVHLRDPETDRYARMSIDIELRSDKDKDFVSARMPRIRESFLTYFSDLTIADLRGSEALNRTKKELLSRLEEAVPGKRIKNLYLSDFVAQ